MLPFRKAFILAIFLSITDMSYGQQVTKKQVDEAEASYRSGLNEIKKGNQKLRMAEKIHRNNKLKYPNADLSETETALHEARAANEQFVLAVENVRRVWLEAKAEFSEQSRKKKRVVSDDEVLAELAKTKLWTVNDIKHMSEATEEGKLARETFDATRVWLSRR